MGTTVLSDRARVKVRRAPASDPPLESHDDPRPWSATAVQPLLQPPGRPRSASHRPPSTPPPTAAGASPECRTAAARFVNTCLEVLNGYRPATHLRTLANPLDAATVLATMTNAARRVAREAGGQSTHSPRVQVRLRRMRVCEPRTGVAEISAVIGTTAAGADDSRCWAGAFRLERRHGRWLCTVAHLL